MSVDLSTLLGERPRDDLDRVLALPLRNPRPAEHAARHWTLVLSPTRERPLRPAQGTFLDALAGAANAPPGPWGARGAVGLLGCGHGKTLCAQLAPHAVKAARNDWRAPQALLVLPAALRPQLRHDVRVWGSHYALALADESQWLSYEQLSGPGSADILYDRAPELLVLDEAHMLGNPESARWRRIARYLAARPETRVVVLSGTLSARGLGEMSHLLFAALRDWSPLPVDGTLPHLAAAVDVGTDPSADDLAVARRVVDWALLRSEGMAGAHGFHTRGTRREEQRSAVFSRVSTAPGVALAHGVAADVSLRIRIWSGPPQPPAVLAALARLRTSWELPDGTELVEALEHHRHERTLSLGFYSRWVPGTVDPDWLAARRRWAAEVRRLLLYSPAAAAAALESPALIERAAAEGRLDARAHTAWDAWAVRRTAGGYDVPYRAWADPPTESVWLDGGREWLVDAAAGPGDWEDPSVVWVGSPAVGAVLASDGASYYGAGSSQPPDPVGPARVVVSHHVHRTGWNGQGWSRALVLERPDGPAAWEQMLARQHRPGARRDVEVVVCCPTLESRVELLAVRQAARFAADALGQPQRLLLADWVWDDDAAVGVDPAALGDRGEAPPGVDPAALGGRGV